LAVPVHGVLRLISSAKAFASDSEKPRSNAGQTNPACSISSAVRDDGERFIYAESKKFDQS
jgi:hypothetical protein